MIRYALRCDKGHEFEGWFRSSDAFDLLAGAGQVACTLCGSCRVSKALMAPSLPDKARAASDAPATPEAGAEARAKAALARLRAEVEANSDYVGTRFADQARAMHDGDMPSRPIHGEARPDEARRLIEDGVPVAPLPFIPRQKTN